MCLLGCLDLFENLLVARIGGLAPFTLLTNTVETEVRRACERPSRRRARAVELGTSQPSLGPEGGCFDQFRDSRPESGM